MVGQQGHKEGVGHNYVAIAEVHATPFGLEYHGAVWFLDLDAFFLDLVNHTMNPLCLEPLGC